MSEKNHRIVNEEISKSTKAGLQRAKARGALLGGENPACRNLNQAARGKGSKHGGAVLKKQAVDAYAAIMPTILDLRAKRKTMQEIADELTKLGHRTRTGVEWTNVQIFRAIKRAAVNEAA